MTKVDKPKKDLIANLLLPTYVKDICAFLRRVGFYRRSVRNFSKIANSLSLLLSKDIPLHFSMKFEGVFTKLKGALTTSPMLDPPIQGEQLELMCVMRLIT